MNPKIEEIVKSLRGCSADVMDCEKCVAGSFHRAWCCDTLRLYAADLIEQLQQELIDERYRHDRLQDFCVAQGEELSEIRNKLKTIVAILSGNDCVEYEVVGLPEPLEEDTACGL